MDEIAFKSWYPNGEKSTVERPLSLKTLIELNIMGQTYHSNFGYYHEDLMYNECEVLDVLDLHYVNMIYYYNEEENYAEIDLYMVRTLAQSTIVPHRKITLVGNLSGHTGWEEKPIKAKDNITNQDVFWYELTAGAHHPNRWFPTEIYPVSSRKYINVSSPFDEVVLDSEIKGSAINLDDIFFASRALMRDDARTSNSYHVVSDNGIDLVMYVDIDNWST